MTAIETWAKTANPGAQFQYCTGFLATAHASAQNPKTKILLDEAAAAAKLAQQGVVTLVQKKLGPFNFAYIAVKLKPVKKGRHND